ncbi:MAG TPA: glycosyltransferase [Candidatus Binatia bacterium]|nr:glycosyltransferase [Candidatus Binatia bacterium]
MRFLIINTDYPEFLGWFYDQHPGLEQKSYDEQMRVRMESLFGVADFYSNNLRKLGHEAWDVHCNNELVQRYWAKEHGLKLEGTASAIESGKAMLAHAARLAARAPLRHLKPIFRRFFPSLNGKSTRPYEILAAQIKHYQPDVVLNQAMDSCSGRFLNDLKPGLKLLVGQIASPLPQTEDFGCYDLIISSLPNFVDYFRRIGVAAELHRFGFEPEILDRLDEVEKPIPVSFIGSLSRDHASRIEWLETVCRLTPIEVWGDGLAGLSKQSWIRKRYQGTAWGIHMYSVLRRSKITLNHHIGIAGAYANNMRLFEATGAGCLLITDWKANLHEMFDVGNEILCYRRPDECAETIQRILADEAKRQAIARAGHERTLRDHTYARRAEELVNILERHL